MAKLLPQRDHSTATRRGKPHGTFCATTSFLPLSAKRWITLGISPRLFKAFAAIIWRKRESKLRYGTWTQKSERFRYGNWSVEIENVSTAASRLGSNRQLTSSLQRLSRK